MEQVLEQREAAVAEGKRKKAEKEATKEHRKSEKAELEVQKRERAEARAVSKAAKDLQKEEKAATRELVRQERLQAAAATEQARQEKIDAAVARCRRETTVAPLEEDDTVRGARSAARGIGSAARGGGSAARGGGSAARGAGSPTAGGWDDSVAWSAPTTPAAAPAGNTVSSDPMMPVWALQPDLQHLWGFSSDPGRMITAGRPSSSPPLHYPTFMPHPTSLSFGNMIRPAHLQAQDVYTPHPNPTHDSFYSPFRTPAGYGSEPRSLR
jgi:hypothetical protein